MSLLKKKKKLRKKRKVMTCEIAQMKDGAIVKIPGVMMLMKDGAIPIIQAKKMSQQIGLLLMKKEEMMRWF